MHAVRGARHILLPPSSRSTAGGLCEVNAFTVSAIWIRGWADLTVIVCPMSRGGSEYGEQRELFNYDFRHTKPNWAF